MFSNTTCLLRIVLNCLELQVEAQGWFENFPQALKPGTNLHEWKSLYEKDSFELDSKTTTTTSRELGHSETTSLCSGTKVLDASCGAAVTCLGYDNLEKIWAAIQDVRDVFYVAHRSYSTLIAEKFETNLLVTTEGHMVKAYTYNSG
jgi:acetylornithine/succinyldiaminopimelate/putrescine aminotransferase